MKTLMSIYVLVIIYAILNSVYSQCQIAEKCVTDLSVADCAPGQVLGPHLTIFSCCPGCQFPTGIIIVILYNI